MLARGDELELLAALHEGGRQNPRWQAFLDALRRRCQADRALLLFCHGAPAISRAAHWTSAREGGEAEDEDDAGALPGALDQMRPNRVYGLDELTEPPGELSAQGAPVFGRAVRVAEPGAWSAWLIVLRATSDFAAADSARLSALAPHVAIAMGNFSALERERLRAAAADDALARAGVAWCALGENGRPVAAGPQPWPPQTAAALVKLWELSGRSEATAAKVVRIDGDPPIDLLSTSIPRTRLAAPAEATMAALTRTNTALRHGATNSLQQMWSLSSGEARLTLAIANGQSLAEAARSCGLTIETARNYSKRIYAKTGARGLADLVRIVLTSVAILA